MSVLTDNKETIDYIMEEIRLQLRNRETFKDVIAQDLNYTVRICGILTTVPSYVYYSIEISEDDLLDTQKVVDLFVNGWCKSDGQENVREFQQFIEYGKRWGWD